jgi:hypothetical protein
MTLFCASNGTGTAYPSGTPGFSGVHVALFFCFLRCVLQTVVWPYVLFLLAFVLSCLPFFDLRLLITLWYIQILLIYYHI